MHYFNINPVVHYTSYIYKLRKTQIFLPSHFLNGSS